MLIVVMLSVFRLMVPLLRVIMLSAVKLSVFLVKAGSGLRPRTKKVKNDCTLSADYYNII